MGILVVWLWIFAQQGFDKPRTSFSDLDFIEVQLESVENNQLERATKSSKIQKAQDFQTFEDNLPSLIEEYRDFAVIQPRYQKKVRRVQLSMTGGLMLNDPWYTQMILRLSGSYHLKDQWGLEIVGALLDGFTSAMASRLESRLGILTTSLVRPLNYVGLHLVWMPFYGKMSLLQSTIVPFDVFFTLGGGLTRMSAVSTGSAATVHLGLGQIFAYSQNLGIRAQLDLHFNSYRSVLTGNEIQAQTVFLTVGGSYFFP